MKVKYKDFEGNEREVDAEVSVDKVSGSINEHLAWEEMTLFLHVDGKVVARKSLDYREVRR